LLRLIPIRFIQVLLYDLRRIRSKTAAAKMLAFSVRWHGIRASNRRKVAVQAPTDDCHDQITARAAAAQAFARLLALVERGEEVVITKRGIPIAMGQPAAPVHARGNAQAVIVFGRPDRVIS
jgi:antitoxin (DNA-binding transcriptional repressor) of toxin-antitoxin stability system